MDENEAVNAVLSGQQAAREQRPGTVVLDEQVKPLSITIPAAIPRETANTVSALCWGDTHFPHHDPAVLAIVRAIAEDMQPDFLVHMGDLLDCYPLSSFDKDPHRKETLQDEIDLAREHLALMRLASPSSRFILLEGNHEDRLRRTLWNMGGAAATLNKLTAFQNAMTWPSLLGLEELRVEWVATNDQAKQRFLPKFILKHGTIVRARSGYTAAAEQAKYSKSGASGHTHRLGATWRKDSNGSHVWVETGCCCDVNPTYCTDPDWQQGCLFLTFDAATGAVQPEPVFIHNGLGVFRGRTYGRATE